MGDLMTSHRDDYSAQAIAGSAVSERLPLEISRSSTATTYEPVKHGKGSGSADSDQGSGLAAFTSLLLPILACVALLVVSLSLCWIKFSRAEVFFAECAREMIEHNNLVTPLYHNRPFFDKPILVYWFIVAMFKSFGINHFVARVPSIIAALSTICGTAVIGRKIGRSNATGLIAAMCLGSSFMFFSFSYLCMSDMFLVLFDTLSLLLLYLGAETSQRRNLYWWLASASMGLAFVTKGPIGIVLPGITLVAYLSVTKQLRAIKPLHVILGAITAAIIAVPWFYAAYQANGTWALAYFFIRENFQRYAGSTYDTHKPLWFMVTSLLSGFLPWSILLPAACSDLFKDFKQKFSTEAGKQRLFMWLWVAVVTGFFSFSRGKCDYYVLPVYPAVSLLVAWHLTAHAHNRLSAILAALTGGIFLIAGLLSPLLLSIIVSHGGIARWWIMPVALTACGAAAIVGARRKRMGLFVTAIFAAVCFAGAGFAWQIMPDVNRSQPLEVYATIMKKAPASTAIGVHDAMGHWIDELTFQTERDNPVELSDSNSIATFFRSGPAIGLMPEDAFTDALKEHPDLSAMQFKILDKRKVSSRPLTPGYVLKRKGDLYDMTLVLVSNRG